MKLYQFKSRQKSINNQFKSINNHFRIKLKSLKNQIELKQNQCREIYLCKVMYFVYSCVCIQICMYTCVQTLLYFLHINPRARRTQRTRNKKRMKEPGRPEHFRNTPNTRNTRNTRIQGPKVPEHLLQAGKALVTETVGIQYQYQYQ